MGIYRNRLADPGGVYPHAQDLDPTIKKTGPGSDRQEKIRIRSRPSKKPRIRSPWFEQVHHMKARKNIFHSNKNKVNEKKGISIWSARGLFKFSFHIIDIY